jgi:hypothetical protein
MALIYQRLPQHIALNCTAGKSLRREVVVVATPTPAPSTKLLQAQKNLDNFLGRIPSTRYLRGWHRASSSKTPYDNISTGVLN